MNGDAEPTFEGACGQKLRDRVAGNRQRQSTGDHAIDANDATSCVGERATGISWSEAHIGLHPRCRAETTNRADGVNHSRGECADETERIANGDSQLTWP